MANKMTDAERIALMRRINDHLLQQQARELNRPAWWPMASMLGAFFAGMTLMGGAIWIAWLAERAH